VLAEAFGGSRGAISTALSINLVLGGLAGLGIGALSDRHQPRVLLVPTAVLAGAGFALVSTVGSLWQLYFFVGVLGGLGMSGFYLLSATQVAHWFVERRGFALALGLGELNMGGIACGVPYTWDLAPDVRLCLLAH